MVPEIKRLDTFVNPQARVPLIEPRVWPIAFGIASILIRQVVHNLIDRRNARQAHRATMSVAGTHNMDNFVSVLELCDFLLVLLIVQGLRTPYVRIRRLDQHEMVNKRAHFLHAIATEGAHRHAIMV